MLLMRWLAVAVVGALQSPPISSHFYRSAHGSSVRGDITPVHDPSGVVMDRGFGFVFSTSYGNEGGVEVRRTSSRVSGENISSAVWRKHTVVFSILDLPEWLHERKLGPSLWAPDVSFHIPTAEWRLYYAASSFGSQRSCIGLAVATSLLKADWVDRGPVFCSDICGPIGKASPHACNAIDPHAIMTGEDVYMTFGSFWTGIKMTKLDARTGLLPQFSDQHLRLDTVSTLWDIAENLDPDPPRPIEASWLEYDPHGRWYWLFANWGMCCRGVQSTYNIRVGRSRNVTGPYLDQAGKSMEKGGGTLLLKTEQEFIGPGQLGLLKLDGGGIATGHTTTASNEPPGGWIASMHYYNGTDAGKPYLRLMHMKSQDGWPVLAPI